MVSVSLGGRLTVQAGLGLSGQGRLPGAGLVRRQFPGGGILAGGGQILFQQGNAGFGPLEAHVLHGESAADDQYADQHQDKYPHRNPSPSEGS